MSKVITNFTAWALSDGSASLQIDLGSHPIFFVYPQGPPPENTGGTATPYTLLSPKFSKAPSSVIYAKTYIGFGVVSSFVLVGRVLTVNFSLPPGIGTVGVVWGQLAY
jgi:hypothetical protein